MHNHQRGVRLLPAPHNDSKSVQQCCQEINFGWNQAFVNME